MTGIRFIAILIITAIIFILAAFVLLPIPAGAHSWYPPNCCSDKDCEPVPIDGVTEEAGGWHVHFISPRLGLIDQHITRKLGKPSQDGGFHGCWRADYFPICFFYPTNT